MHRNPTNPTTANATTSNDTLKFEGYLQMICIYHFHLFKAYYVVIKAYYVVINAYYVVMGLVVVIGTIDLVRQAATRRPAQASEVPAPGRSWWSADTPGLMGAG